MDTEHSYYARVLDEVERLQPVGAGGGILVLNLMYPCFEPGARVGMDLSVRSGDGLVSGPVSLSRRLFSDACEKA